MLLNYLLVALHSLRRKLEFSAVKVPSPATTGGCFAINYYFHPVRSLRYE